MVTHVIGEFMFILLRSETVTLEFDGIILGGGSFFVPLNLFLHFLNLIYFEFFQYILPFFVWRLSWRWQSLFQECHLSKSFIFLAMFMSSLLVFSFFLFVNVLGYREYLGKTDFLFLFYVIFLRGLIYMWACSLYQRWYYFVPRGKLLVSYWDIF